MKRVMRMKLRDVWLSFLCFLYSFCITPLAIGQNLELKYTEFKDNKLLVHYSLSDSIVGRSYTVRLYSSKDAFLNPLEKTAGDVGLEVKPGANNKIIWDAREELGPLFDGKVSLEIRERIFVAFISTESINQYKIFKRGRKYNITWSGGSAQNILNFDLLKGERKIFTIPNLANVGHQTIEFPTSVRPGKGYRFKISDTKNKEDIVYTSQFIIRRKLPLLLKAVPTMIIGSALYLLFQPKPVEPDLPNPLTISK